MKSVDRLQRVRDLIAIFWEQNLIVLEDVLRPAYFVPKTMRAVDLLAEMKDLFSE